MKEPRICAWKDCNNPIPPDAHKSRIFCCKRCAEKSSRAHKPDPTAILQSFISAHPTKEVTVCELSSSYGMARSLDTLPVTKGDLHSVLNKRRVRTAGSIFDGF